MKIIKGQVFDEERALYNLQDTVVEDCTFAGEADGESVLKEARNIELHNCKFALRYPVWHVQKYLLKDTAFGNNTRAPIWYSNDGVIDGCKFEDVKALRECNNTVIKNSNIYSTEFGWKCDGVDVSDTKLVSEYVFFDSKNIKLSNVNFQGKYSFQYVENLEIENCYLDTKDAFWHSKNITVKDSTVKGEYLAWFSENLTLINCKISGTQPLCYCKNLKLINCTMDDTDLSFEYSEVEADIKGYVESIKNPKSGKITVDELGELILEDSIMESSAEVVVFGERVL